MECALGSSENGGGTAKSVVPGFILIRKSIIPIPRVGHSRRKRARDREEERKWRPGGKSDTKSKETPSQSAAPPLYHWVLTLARCHPRAHKLALRIEIIIASFFCTLSILQSPSFLKWHQFISIEKFMQTASWLIEYLRTCTFWQSIYVEFKTNISAKRCLTLWQKLRFNFKILIFKHSRNCGINFICNHRFNFPTIQLYFLIP